jgi:hypothetical protein
MTNCIRSTFATAVLVLTTAVASSAQHPAMPKGMTHEEHLAQMKKDAELRQRGAAAMGFDQDATTHHFRLREDGGSIDVEVRSGADPAVRDAVRAHLREIAVEFAEGNFDKPFATHGEVPSGAGDMIRLKRSISYVFEDLENGGRVRIRAVTPAARDAVHEFLTYQIREHRTNGK